ncbi:TetR/AcrR family transcriptional regulator [Nocardiopsis potens]|uniref:TetR/AcrR family transcriptional regulator n=1 Tax=Nocardiopsis potens TaxID=1246458 RepID=UPI00034AC1A2|nr:TetR/AcrR family transcriptional regulator [Nocardiopsis potens]
MAEDGGRPIASAWTRPRKRREQPALSREQIVAEAVRLLDGEGLDALSMRRLGGRLNAGATSLYRHVANRDELLELVVDEVYGEIEAPPADTPEEWRGAAAVCARSARSVVLRHPWIAPLIGQIGMAYLGPNVMRLHEGMLALFEAGGFDPVDADGALNTLMAFVLGSASSEAAWKTTVARSGIGEDEWLRRLRPAAEEAARPYRRLHARYLADEGEDPAQVRDASFEYGLQRVLDGLEARLGRTDG